MAANGNAARVYALSDGVRVFRSGDEIRFRKGVWSYTEAAVRLTGQEQRVVQFFGRLYEILVKGGEATSILPPIWGPAKRN